MKKNNILILLVLTFLLSACSGSDTYRGDWKATDVNGAHYEMNFDADNFSIENEEGEVSSYEYSQNSISTQNGVETYGIKIDDGRTYQINFPVADDESVGLVADGNGTILYTIGRGDYVTYEDIMMLNK